MERIKTTTPKGKNGFDISYDDEISLGKELLKVIPPDYKIEFSWYRGFLLDCDVKYLIDLKTKTVLIGYTQNLRHWSQELIKEIPEAIKTQEGEYDC